MSVLDLAIIYLACGAPLSMHYFFAQRHKPTGYFIVVGTAVTLFWPVAAVTLLVNALSLRPNRMIGPHTAVVDRELDAIRTKIENIAFKNGNATSVFEFREVFSRYAGLIKASKIANAATEINEIFRLSSHANAQLATRCLNRNAANRLASHANHARRDFIDFAGSIPERQKSTVMVLLSETAVLLDDEQTIGDLRRLGERSRRPNRTDLRRPDQGVEGRIHATLN